MTTLTDLATEISTQLQTLVASGTLIDLTRQRSSTGTLDSTLLLAAANFAARRVQRVLGRTVDDSDDDAVDFGVRISLLNLATEWSLTLTEAGAAYTAGVYKEMRDEAGARRQAHQGFDLTEEDLGTHDDRWPEEEWDDS